MGGHHSVYTKLLLLLFGKHHQECIAPNVDISLQSGRFWAMSVASFRERLLDFRSCWIVFIHVVRGSPDGLLQFLTGEAVKVFYQNPILWTLRYSEYWPYTVCESMDKLISTISCCCQPTVPLLRIATYHFIHTGHTSSCYYNNKIHDLQLLLNHWTQTKYSSTTTTYVFLLVVCVTIVEHKMKVIDAFLCTWILLQFQLLLYCTHVHRMLYYTIIVL